MDIDRAMRPPGGSPPETLDFKRKLLLRNKASEIPEYVVGARKRAQRRKSLWNLILIPLCVIGIAGVSFLLFMIMWQVHIVIHPEHAGRMEAFFSEKGSSVISKIATIFFTLPLFFAAMPLGLMFGNCVAWLVGPARRAFDREAKGVKGASFREAMHGLWDVTKVFVPACLILSFIAAILLK